MRINRYLASAGFGSRRKCEELIREGKVRRNGEVITDLSTVIQEGARVEVEGRLARLSSPEYYLLYKPRGVVCTLSDEYDRVSIFNLLPPQAGRLFHVGRLDMESEGLLLLTNDGSLTQKLTHPTHGAEKEYEVVLNRSFDPALLQKLCHGFVIIGGRAKAERAFMLAANKLKIVLRQGIKRQIRLMFAKLGYDVKRLMRVRIGRLEVGGLKPGRWRKLGSKDLALLTAPPPPRRPSSSSGKLQKKKTFLPKEKIRRQTKSPDRLTSANPT